jgi:hypothetical protein
MYVVLVFPLSVAWLIWIILGWGLNKGCYVGLDLAPVTREPRLIRFRNEIIPLGCGVVAYWLLSCLIAIAANSFLHIPFLIPAEISLWTFFNNIPAFIGVLGFAAVTSNKLAVWRRPFRAIIVTLAASLIMCGYEATLPNLDFDAYCSYSANERARPSDSQHLPSALTPGTPLLPTSGGES